MFRLQASDMDQLAGGRFKFKVHCKPIRLACLAEDSYDTKILSYYQPSKQNEREPELSRTGPKNSLQRSELHYRRHARIYAICPCWSQHTEVLLTLSSRFLKNAAISTAVDRGSFVKNREPREPDTPLYTST